MTQTAGPAAGHLAGAHLEGACLVDSPPVVEEFLVERHLVGACFAAASQDLLAADKVVRAELDVAV